MTQRATFDPDRDFDLFKSHAATGCLFLTLLIAIYALLDGVYWPGDNYAEDLPYSLFLVAGVVASLVAGIALRYTILPVMEAAGIALVFGIAMALAAVPGALRINGMTDETGSTTHTYVLREKGVLEPEQADLPIIEQPVYAPFWQDQPIGSTWEFKLRKGMLGFWQYDSRTVLEQISIDAVWQELNSIDN